jgi:hypothetical protein
MYTGHRLGIDRVEGSVFWLQMDWGVHSGIEHFLLDPS